MKTTEASSFVDEKFHLTKSSINKTVQTRTKTVHCCKMFQNRAGQVQIKARGESNLKFESACGTSNFQDSVKQEAPVA